MLWGLGSECLQPCKEPRWKTCYTNKAPILFPLPMVKNHKKAPFHTQEPEHTSKKGRRVLSTMNISSIFLFQTVLMADFFLLQVPEFNTIRGCSLLIKMVCPAITGLDSTLPFASVWCNSTPRWSCGGNVRIVQATLRHMQSTPISMQGILIVEYKAEEFEAS